MSATDLHSPLCTLHAADAAATQQLAAALARQCRRGDCILLRGDLGAGKTTFARGFIQALNPDHSEVVSPTFTLVQTYPTKSGEMIWHFDLYRLKHPSDVEEIGLDEALHQGITLIEWPELIQSQLPEDALDVTIETFAPDERRFIFTGLTAIWRARLDILKETA